MIATRRLAVVTMLSTLFASAVACPREKGRTNPGATSLEAPAAAADTTALLDTLVHWDSAAGPALVLSMDSVADTVSVIRPEYTDGRYSDTSMVDLRSLSHMRFDLFGRSGAFSGAILTLSSPRWRAGSDDACLQWPTATMSASRRGWRAALQTGNATAIPVDSIVAMSSTDSALFIAQVIRIASWLPQGHDSAFNTVPFTVRSAYRFRTAVVDGIIAALQRNIPSEAMPREEHVFFIAERPIGSSDDYHLAFFTRAAGAEGSSTVTDVLALVLLTRAQRPALIVSDEEENGGKVAWIERTAPGQWRMTWRSAYTGC